MKINPEDCYFVVVNDDEGAFGDYEGEDIVVMITPSTQFDETGYMYDQHFEVDLPLVVGPRPEMEGCWIVDREAFPNVVAQDVANAMIAFGFKRSESLEAKDWWESDPVLPNNDPVDGGLL